MDILADAVGSLSTDDDSVIWVDFVAIILRSLEDDEFPILGDGGRVWSKLGSDALRSRQHNPCCFLDGSLVGYVQSDAKVRPKSQAAWYGRLRATLWLDWNRFTSLTSPSLSELELVCTDRWSVLRV